MKFELRKEPLSIAEVKRFLTEEYQEPIQIALASGGKLDAPRIRSCLKNAEGVEENEWGEFRLNPNVRKSPVQPAPLPLPSRPLEPQPQTGDKCLTLKQPWAWAIFHAGKDVENRNWNTPHRGRLWIHAGTRRDTTAQPTFARLGIVVPTQLECGTILGYVEVVGVTQSSPSPWAIADSYHWEIAHPSLLHTPIPAKGQLGLWSYTNED